MRISGRMAGLVGGAVGILATCAAVGTALYQHRRDSPDDLYTDEPFGKLKPDHVSSVVTDDGVVLSVEEIDPADGGKPDLTVVLVHGFALSRQCWHFQRRMLAELSDPRVKQVLYDQRGHGRSGRPDARSCTIEQLARDLDEVLRAVVPDGRIVLVGHSMGGMTIMALAGLRPELFAERIVGVALIGTSAGDVGKYGVSKPLLSRYNPLTIGVGHLADWQPGLVELVRAAGGQLTRRAVRLLGFGSAEVSPRLVDFMMEMLSVTPVRVLADFIETLGEHNRYDVLAGLKESRVLVLGGDADRLTPFTHAERISDELPDAELARIKGAGHMVMLEQPDLVNLHLVELLRTCASGSGWIRGRRWWRKA